MTWAIDSDEDDKRLLTRRSRKTPMTNCLRLMIAKNSENLRLVTWILQSPEILQLIEGSHFLGFTQIWEHKYIDGIKSI